MGSALWATPFTLHVVIWSIVDVKNIVYCWRKSFFWCAMSLSLFPFLFPLNNLICSNFHPLYISASESPGLNFCLLHAKVRIYNCLCFLCLTNIFQSLLPPVPLFCLCTTSNQAELLWVCLSSGIFILVFAALAARTARTNLKHQQTKCLSISQQLHTAHSCYAALENIVLLLHFRFIFTPFIYFSPTCFQTTTNNFCHTLCPTAVS